MKRPLFLFFVGLVSGELVAMIGNWTGGFVLALIVCLSGAILRKQEDWRLFFHQKPKMAEQNQKKHVQKQKRIILTFCLALFLGFVHFLSHAHADRCRRQQLPRENVCLQGRIGALTVNAEGKYRITLEQGIYCANTGRKKNKRRGVKEKKRGKRVPGKCQILSVNAQQKTLMPGDWISLTGDLVNLDEPTNPGAFDGRIYALSRGITCQFWAKSCKKIGESFFCPGRKAWICRQKIAAVYRQIMEETEAALLSAMILGDKSRLSQEQKKRYEDSGTAHLLAVSGLHVSVVSGSLFHWLRKRKLSYGICCAVGAAVVFFYGSMTGMGNAVLRAAIMYGVYLGAEYFGTEYDLVSSLSLAGILMILESPWRILEGGSQISFFAVFALGLVLPWVRELEERRTQGKSQKSSVIRQRLKEAWLTNVVMTGVTLPVVLRVFYQFCPYSILLNLLVIPAMLPLMSGGCFAGITGLCSLTLGKWVAYPAVFLLHLFDALFIFVKKLTFALVVTGCPSWMTVAGIYILEGWLLYLWYKRKRRSMVYTGVAVAFGWGLFSLNPLMQVTMLDVGQGEAIYLRTPEGANILMDGGSTSTSGIGQSVLKPALQYYGAGKVDYLMVSHADEDHISGIRELLQMNYPVEYLVIRQGGRREEALAPLLKLAKKNGTEVMEVKAGDRLVFQDVILTCLHPPSDFSSEDRNEASLVFHVGYHRFDLLLTGDLGALGEKYVDSRLFPGQTCREKRQKERKTEILKVAHHGSKSSTSFRFLQKLQPENALISSGRGNRYGHPHEELKERLRKRKVRMWQTREGGAIGVKTDGRRYQMGYFYKKLANQRRLSYSTTCR